MEKIAIIAGVGELPYLFLEVAKKEYDVHILALFSECDSRLKSHENYFQVSFSDIPQAMTYLIFQQISKVIMLGKVEKKLIFGEGSSHSDALAMLSELKDKKDETIVFEIINFLKHSGIEVMPQNFMLENLMVEKKIYTNVHPTTEDERTIHLGLEAAKMLTTLDVGQTVVCKDMSVVALEGIEGTDKTIDRAGEYAGKGTIIVKVARPNQDPRVDIPTIGLDTVKKAVEIGAKGIVVESEKMFFLGQEETIKLANEHSLFIVGV